MTCALTSAPVPDAKSDVRHFAQRRMAIDLIATTRARAIRSALFGTYLYRPDPANPDTAQLRAHQRAVLAEQLAAFDRACALIKGHDPEDEVPDAICQWIASHAETAPDEVQAIHHMRDLTAALVQAADAGGSTLGEALQAHYVFGRPGFFEAVTEFCDGLWHRLDTIRHTDINKARQAGDTITTTLDRLERIGRHVRLVSINASVEAARVGDAGRGLGVIAVEFKSLAEEIQRLTLTARAEIGDLTGTASADGSKLTEQT